MRWSLAVAVLAILALVVVFTRAKTPRVVTGDGFQVHPSVLSPSEVEAAKRMDNKSLKEHLMRHDRIREIVSSLGPGYEFQDYVFILKKSSIHTCHRDANGDMFNFGQKHPSYTMLVFLEGSDNCLEVSPGSRDGRAVDLDGASPFPCRPGDVFLFDANTVHAGAIGPDRLRVQMKVTHREDRGVLGYYENYNKVADHESTMPDAIKGFHQDLSCAFPFVADMTQEDVKKGSPSKVFSQVFYGNKDFYTLNDAF